MKKLIREDGSVGFGLYQEPVDEINFQDYMLLTPSGRTVPGVLKRLRYKTFHFMGVSGPGFMAGFAIVDLGYLASGFGYLYDVATHTLNEKSCLTLPLKQRVLIRPTPECPFSRFSQGALSMEMDHQGIRVDSGNLCADITLVISGKDAPLRLCTRTGYTGWSFTRKSLPLSVEGTIKSKGRAYDLGRGESFALTDWTGGFLRRKTFWNWAAISTALGDGRTLGLNISWGVNETGFTENAFWINGSMEKVDMVCFSSTPDGSGDQWRITSFDGKVALDFTAEGSRGERINAGVIASSFTQYFGRFSGYLNPTQGDPVAIQGVPGWFEDHYAKW
ncbi:MAG: DUF2804 domain-containing protein [Pseudomonadota bacterium]